MSISSGKIAGWGVRALKRWTLTAALAMVGAAPDWCAAEDVKENADPARQQARDQAPPAERNNQAAPAPTAPDQKLPSPEKIPDAVLAPVLHTVPVAHDRMVFNVQMVNAALLPRDKDGIWVLDFEFKPLRIKTVEIPGKGRRQVHYLYYKVTNRTGKPRMFVPEFIMVNEAGQKYPDNVVPQAIPVIQVREDAAIPLLGAVNIIGVIPPSTKAHVDDAIYGVATWDKWDPKADRFSIYVRGLSDGYKEVSAAGAGKPSVKYKTLRIDFIRRGDEHNLNEKEIYLNDPPYEWIYW
jgi:hypothetical protein